MANTRFAYSVLRSMGEIARHPFGCSDRKKKKTRTGWDQPSDSLFFSRYSCSRGPYSVCQRYGAACPGPSRWMAALQSASGGLGNPSWCFRCQARAKRLLTKGPLTKQVTAGIERGSGPTRETENGLRKHSDEQQVEQVEKEVLGSLPRRHIPHLLTICRKRPGMRGASPFESCLPPFHPEAAARRALESKGPFTASRLVAHRSSAGQTRSIREREP